MSIEDDLEQRIEELETENEEIRQTLQKMLPNRRDMLKMGFGAAAGAIGLSISDKNTTIKSDRTGHFSTQPDSLNSTDKNATSDSVNTQNKGVNDLAVKSITADEQNDTVYASQNIALLPSIQQGLDKLNGDDKRRLVIVGGRNLVENTIDLTGRGFRTGVNGVGRIEIETRGAHITQNGNVGLSEIIKCGEVIVDLDVTIDGNQSNNSTNVDAITLTNNRTGSSIDLWAFDCNTGLYLANHTERMEANVYAESCAVGVKEDGTSPSATAENEISICGYENSLDYKRHAPGETHLRIQCEQGETAVEVNHSEARVNVNGVCRAQSTRAIHVIDGEVSTGSGYFHSSGAESVFVEGGSFNSAADTYFNDSSDSSSSYIRATGGNVSIAFPWFLDTSNGPAVDFQDGIHNIIMPLRMVPGSNSGTTVKVGDAGAGTSAVVRGLFHSGNLSNRPVNVEGGRLEPGPVVGTPSDTQRNNFPDIPGFIIFNRTSGVPEYYDGTDWRTVIDGSTT